ncbi:hypothetical protein HOK00_02690 [bacterium]|jgi:hypothetical protein|nr:hypothetical protein [bacterium]
MNDIKLDNLKTLTLVLDDRILDFNKNFIKENFKPNKRFNIVLSPLLYKVNIDNSFEKKEEIFFEGKNIDLYGNSHSFSYYFLLNKKNILSSLKKLSIESKNINSIYFAENIAASTFLNIGNWNLIFKNDFTSSFVQKEEVKFLEEQILVKESIIDIYKFSVYVEQLKVKNFNIKKYLFSNKKKKSLFKKIIGMFS